MSDCYCRKIPLLKITSNPDVLERIEDLVLRTNLIVRETYQFVRAYFLWLLEKQEELPIIDRSFLKLVFSVISDRPKRRSNHQKLSDKLQLFYEEEYSKVQLTRVKAVGKDMLDYEIISIVTSVENHIKNSFFTYINRFMYSLESEDKVERNRIRKDIFDGSSLCKDDYRNIVVNIGLKVRTYLKQLYSDPQSCIPLLYEISCFIQSKGKKQLAILPLRRSLVPCHVTIDSNNFKESFRDLLKNQLDIWKNIVDVIYDEVGCKENFSFSSLKTDGVACSLTFTVEKRSKKKREKSTEIYFEDLQNYEEFKGKKIVAIDPNKGNLVYCYDGENVLRYTQDERRHVSRKTKYKKIRKKVEDILVRSPVDDRFHTVEEDTKNMSKYNSRTCNYTEFMSYLSEKNKMGLRYDNLYQEKIFRKLRFNTKINLKRSEDTFINRFRDMYGSDVVIVFGDWEERPNFLRGKEPTKGKSLRSMFRKAGYTVYLLDEFRTSKTCHVCKAENENQFISRPHPKPWKKMESQKVWGLLRCKNGNCRRVHNRDFNSSSNILNISKYIIQTGFRPDEFMRSSQAFAST